MNLSVCIITKNECENLEKCLIALKNYDLEIVVVDTGSTDATMDMVAQYTDSVYTFQWCDDFAKAKNYAVSKAKHDMVLVLDSDEYVISMDLNRLEQQIRQHGKSIGRIMRCNQLQYGAECRISTEYINRVFDRRLFHYAGRVHEQLVWRDGEYKGSSEGIETYRTEIQIDHSGYLLTADEKNDKAERNILLLKQMLEEQEDDTYLLYQLGKSYYLCGQYTQACESFERALCHEVDERLEYVIDMVTTYGYALLNTGRAQDALGFEGLQDAFGGTSDFCFLMGLIYMNNELYDEAIDSYMKAVQLKNANMIGTDSYLSYYNAGVIAECLGKIDEAAAYYRKAGEYPAAKERIAGIMKLN